MLFLLLAAIPCIVNPAGAGMEFCPNPASSEEWEKLPAPGMTIGIRGAGTASATRAPWVDSNGWRFLRNPGGKYLYEPVKGKAALAAAEAFAFGADARLQVAPEDLKPLSGLLAFFRSLPGVAGLVPATNIAVVDSGSKAIPEAINLMVRRNLLCRVVSAPDPAADLNVRIGSPEFPEEEAGNPVAVADKARKLLTDRKRLLRIYGTEVVIGRLYARDGRARLHLLNYSSGSVMGIRVRVRGNYRGVRLTVFGFEGAKAEDVVVQNEAIEFTVPEMGTYAVVDFNRSE